MPNIKHTGFLQKIGISGWEHLEVPIFASLITGDPLIMVGGHGEAKTLAARRIAALMGTKFGEFNCAMSNFEDVLGFPNIESLKQGKLDYVYGPNTIWGKEFVFLDELSRSSSGMQNKWLEVIRSRSINGFPTGATFVWSAMNPLTNEYRGTKPLDLALAERFAYILVTPSAIRFNTETKQNVMSSFSSDDAPALKLESIKLEDIQEYSVDFLELLNKVRTKLYPTIEEYFGHQLKLFNIGITTILNASKLSVSGRRMSMLYRSMIACICAKMSLNLIREIGDDQVNDICSTNLPYLLPYVLTGENSFDSGIMGRMAEAGRRAYKNGGAPFEYELIGADNFDDLYRILINNSDQKLRSDMITRIKTKIMKYNINYAFDVLNEFINMKEVNIDGLEVISKSIGRDYLFSLPDLPDLGYSTDDPDDIINAIVGINKDRYHSIMKESFENH